MDLRVFPLLTTKVYNYLDSIPYPDESDGIQLNVSDKECNSPPVLRYNTEMCKGEIQRASPLLEEDERKVAARSTLWFLFQFISVQKFQRGMEWF